MQNLQPPIKGDRPRVEWGAGVVEAIKVGRVTGGGGIIVAEDMAGTSIRAKKNWPEVRKDDNCARPCKITGGNALDGYAVDIYANGISETKTDTGTLYILEISATATLAAGSWVLGWPQLISITIEEEA